MEHNSESVAGTYQRVDSVGLRAALAVFGFVLVDIVGDGDFCDGIRGECDLAHGVPPVAVMVVILAVWYVQFTVRPSMASVLFSVIFYQFFYSNAESVGQSGDRANGYVLGLNLAGFDLPNLPGIDARKLCKLCLCHALAGADGV